MRTKAAIVMLLLCGAGAAASQPVELPPVHYPDVQRTASGAAGFVPTGWTIIARRQGDLNGDGAADLVLLLRMADPANILSITSGDQRVPFDTNPHWLLVAFAERGGYRLVSQNRDFFPRPQVPFTGDVPPNEDTIRLERGSLVVFFEYLRGWARYRFRWQGGVMRLTGYDDSGVAGGCVLTTSINYLTGRARLGAGLISSNRGRTAWRRVQGPTPPDLDQIDLAEFFPDESITGPPLMCQELYDG